MRYSPEHKAQTRARVLAEAAAAIRADGSDRFGVAAVMARAGLTHGGFYAHFASRDELLAAAVGHMLDERFATYFADADTVEPRVALDRFVARYLSLRHVERRDTGCPLPILAGEAHRLPAAAQARFADGIARLTAAVSALAARAGTAGPSGPATLAVIAEMVGAVALARTLPAAAAADLLAGARTSVRHRLGLDGS